MGEAAAQRAGRIGGDAVAMAAEKFPQRLLRRPGLDVPQRNVDRGECRGEAAARPAGRSGAAAQLGDDVFDALRILADGERRERFDRGAQAAGQVASSGMFASGSSSVMLRMADS